MKYSVEVWTTEEEIPYKRIVNQKYDVQQVKGWLNIYEATGNVASFKESTVFRFTITAIE